MNHKAKFVLSTLAIASLGLVGTSFPIAAEDVPGALAVEWEGKKPCEKLFEDEHFRVARCTFAKGTVHVCHTHPSYLTYVLSGGQAEVQDDKGKRNVEVVTGTFADVPPIPWHEFANVGEITLRYLVVEKYQPAGGLLLSRLGKLAPQIFH
jgi:quercetin dioxygenase-like cupin family protein